MPSNKPYIVAIVFLVFILLGLVGLFIFFPPDRAIKISSPKEENINSEKIGVMDKMKDFIKKLPIVGADSKKTPPQTELTNTNNEVEELKTNPSTATPGSAGLADDSAVLQARPLGFKGKLPPAGVPFTDPVFGTTLVRLTSQTDKADFANHDYSQLQAFSRDNKYVIVNTGNGTEVLEVETRQRSALAPQNNINVPRWQPALPHTLLWIDSNEDQTIRIQYANVDTGQVTDHFVFPEEFDRIRVNQSFDELSDDGQWLAGMATLSNNDDHIFALNLETKRFGTQLSLPGLYSTVCAEDSQYGQLQPDWIGVSPLGNYLVVNWSKDGTDRCTGQEVYDIKSGEYLGHSYSGHQHGDLALTNDGREVFISSINDSGRGTGLPGIAEYSLPNGANSPRIIRELPWHGLWHISCRGPRGMCLITSFDGEEGWDLRGVLEQEIYLIYFDGSVRRLTHHRSSGCGYWVQPRASLSYDGRYGIFDSDFNIELGGANSCARKDISEPDLGGGEVFLILLPEEARKSPNNSTSNSKEIIFSQAIENEIISSDQETNTTMTEVSTNLGTVADLPQSTYTPKKNESVDFLEAQPPYTLSLKHNFGHPDGDTCFDTDFIQYDFYTAPLGSEKFTQVGSHSEVASPFINGHEVESQGCAKGTFLYTLTTGSYQVSVCITNTKNPAERYCTTPFEVTSK